MNPKAALASILFAATVLAAFAVRAAEPAADPLAYLDGCNVVWKSPSNNAHDSMPLGNGDVGVNAWVEPSGDLVFYISKTDAWDENDRSCKIGRIRVKFDPPLAVAGENFRHELKLREGLMEIAAAIGGKPAKIRLWVDAEQPVVRVDAESDEPAACRAEVELWRLRERPFGGIDDSHSGNGLGQHPSKPVVLPDTVVVSDAPRVTWYHHNSRSIFSLTLANQNLQELEGQFADPLLHQTFGAILSGAGMVRDGDRGLKSAGPVKRHQLAISVLAEKAEKPEAWLARMEEVDRKAAQASAEESLRRTAKWWNAFWGRSWVVVQKEGEAASRITHGYVMQRFLTACAGRGGAPIKFNGSIFTVEKAPGAPANTPDGDPDWRAWGGCYWFQNTRPTYWAMPPAGDFEMMEPWFRAYLDALPLSKARVKTYYQFANAAVFPETMYFWGLPNNGDYGWGNKAPEPSNGYIKRYWSGNLELIAVMLDRYDFTRDDEFARKTLVPLADPLVSFLDQYFKRDANGKIRFEPSQSLETWHVAVNPLPEIAGLRFLLPRLLALPKEVTTDQQRQRWQRLLGELPPIPIREVNGKKLIQPAETFTACANAENPELYSVYPYRLYGVGHENLAMARDTYAARRCRSSTCWSQDGIQAALLGLAAEAGREATARAAAAPAYRFPAMWGPFNDWIPDQDHGANMLVGLHFMLLQYDGDRIFLFPAWPKEWNVAFKLHAPKNTMVEGVYRGGKVQNLKVTPPSRMADVKNMLEQ